MVNWDLEEEQRGFEMCMKNYRQYKEEAQEALERGDRKEYYVCRDLAFTWMKEARDCYQIIQWLEENNYG